MTILTDKKYKQLCTDWERVGKLKMLESVRKKMGNGCKERFGNTVLQIDGPEFYDLLGQLMREI